MLSKDVDFLGLLKTGMSSTPVGVVLVNAQSADMPIVFANQAFFDMTGYCKKEVIGNNCRLLQGAATNKNTVKAINKALRECRYGKFSILNYRKNGSRFWNQLTLSPVINSEGVCTHYLGFQQDVTKEREQEALLSYQANHDLLTGLLNRSALDDALEQRLFSANLANEFVVVMCLNLDEFKVVNDGLGYKVGNELVKQVAERLKRLLAPRDLIARLNGDEFALVVFDCQCYRQANKKAHEVLESLLKTFVIDSVPLHISGSIGISCNQRFNERAYELMQEASIAMTEAKSAGRNTWCWSHGQPNNILSSEVAVNLRYELSSALLDHQFELFYQPIINLNEGSVRSYEALIRWRHPEKGLISPGLFIPIAEQTGQIIPLGLWVLRQACADVLLMQRETGRSIPVAVNISPLQFRREDFFEIFLDVVSEFDLSLDLIQIEVTESLLIDGSSKAIDLVEKFRSVGVKVALDDFGTGYSSLSYIRSMPLDKIKLDRSFIKEIDTDLKSAAIVKAVVDMSHSLGLKVVAEGVETESQLDVLARYQCDYVQGFLFSKPLPLLDIIDRS
ncbi:EAL domain-containing protein [Halomonas sp. DWK9]|uniref:EAL domain-containing protein n=1 Tax=Halomonas sp. DWK9 TaxID=3060155 RepID=UPI00287F7F3A|nr:EAL domain-containing protein [Halomonas sp. DWK9]